MTEPLTGRNVLVTRPPGQSDALKRLIEAEGGTALVLPMIETIRTEDWDPLKKRAAEKKWDWVIFTSANAAAYFSELLAEVPLSVPETCRTAAVGKKTAEAVRKRGWPNPLLPRVSDGDGLADLLQSRVRPGDSVLFPKSVRARSVIADVLQREGAYVHELPLYTTAAAYQNREQLLSWIQEGTIDLLTFTSPSAVKAFAHFVRNMPKKDWQGLDTVSIGSITDNEAAKHGFVSRRTAEPSTVEGIVRTLTAF
ncbi:uroporphyrinogen-III synthase [Salibacterium halotolerans]|uniref:Uroporphyrinogen-III synthase n=1 Tax=Salibacterium halotolerans TaxID=1884432 RepID=A0A1I5SRY4_9BACI|nr:uroporphyrinogen-III synthase [Salibacterium halotolerans]SFP73554.1 uroporphyrinogen-III synthase/uroporphyrinogen III methyltransferase / synthase [Salibacterium halotolerans]